MKRLNLLLITFLSISAMNRAIAADYSVGLSYGNFFPSKNLDWLSTSTIVELSIIGTPSSFDWISLELSAAQSELYGSQLDVQHI